MNNYLQLMEDAASYIHEARPKLDTPEAIADFLRPILADREQECMVVVLLDTKYQAIGVETVHVGTADRCMAHPRDIFRAAVRSNAFAIVMAHNHPTGDPAPSSQDRRVTQKIFDAGELLGIKLVDSLIIGKRTPERYADYVSFRESVCPELWN